MNNAIAELKTVLRTVLGVGVQLVVVDGGILSTKVNRLRTKFPSFTLRMTIGVSMYSKREASFAFWILRYSVWPK